MAADPQKVVNIKLRASSLCFGFAPQSGHHLSRADNIAVTEVCGPLMTTVTLLDDGDTRICVVATDWGQMLAINVSTHFRRALAAQLNILPSNVLIMASHNHSDVKLASNQVHAYLVPADGAREPQFLPEGQQLLTQLCDEARKLPELLEPVSVWWAEGHEDRITYNRKGRRADGSTFFMREEDRILQGADYRGDVDTVAPIVVFQKDDATPIAAWVQFTGHPVTSYSPEHPIVFGDWPQVACNYFARYLAEKSDSPSPPVSFLQGCAGDVNSKEMFRGGVRRATEFGKLLGESYAKAVPQLQPSRRDGLDFASVTVDVPLAPLPDEAQLSSELTEIDEFMRRAYAKDENTLMCVGLNFPRELSPWYRAQLIEKIRPWYVWAMDLYRAGIANSVPNRLPMEIYVIRVGDVGVVGLPCEPFQGIGRQIRAGSRLPLTIPCGYTNISYGYITDGGNTGDREYMSSFHRYTRFRPPLQYPAGDVLAAAAIELLNRTVEEQQ